MIEEEIAEQAIIDAVLAWRKHASKRDVIENNVQHETWCDTDWHLEQEIINAADKLIEIREGKP